MKTRFLWMVILSMSFFISCNNAPKQETGGQSDQVQVVEEQVLSAPDWTQNTNIYEVNLRQYTKEGTLQAFAKELPRLKDMGVDILWFMPIHPIGEKNRKGTLGSYYAVKDYKAVNPDYGNFDDFKMVVEEAHKLGMHVMLDWVANHTSWDNVWVDAHPEFYEKDENGDFISPFDWTDVISLDYSNKDMRAAMIDALKFWIAQADIDGYRCDVASEVPTDFWEEARPQLQAIKPVFMLAESEQADLLEKAFDMNYGWEFHHIMNQVAKGEKNVKDILAYLVKEDSVKPDRAYMMYFLTNHDENSWNGTIEERLGDAEDAMAVMCWTLGGMPLIYSGQESANSKRLDFFEKDVIDWKDYRQSDFYGKLNAIKHQESAIWNGKHGGDFEVVENNQSDKVLVFKKSNEDEEILVVLNLSSEVLAIDLPLADYQVLDMNGLDMNASSLNLQAWAWGIFKK